MAPSQNNLPFVLNVGNSIIGVTLLAMPFCFKLCGIVLGSLLLFFSTLLTLRSCQLLMKAGVTSRRRSYSLLALYTHGATGKLIVELGMIGLQIGTLVAQLVIIGDLGPTTVSKVIGIPVTDQLRTGTIVCVCMFVALPLGLLKDLRTLSKASMMCILFYVFFTLFIVLQSFTNLWKGDWVRKVSFWNMDGFFRCLPIFSFAFGCQTQLFIVYDALAEPSLKRINSIVGSAVHMCALVYLMVGFFGYIAFCDEENLSGDIITHLTDGPIVDLIKLCFVTSIAVSLPLIVFPCRASLYTLLFPQKHKDDLPGHGKIPEFHFTMITVCIITVCMITTILIPNIEVVLALTGATTGCLICYIFPALFFLNVMSDGAEKMSGRVVLAFGLIIMIASTYTTLTSSPSQEVAPVVKRADLQEVHAFTTQLPEIVNKMAIQEKVEKPDNQPLIDRPGDDTNRQEPPIPQEPDDVQQGKETHKDKNKEEIKDLDKKLAPDKAADKDAEKFEKIGDVNVDQVHVQDVGKEDKKEYKMEQLDKQKDNEKAQEDEKKKEAERKQEEILHKLEQQQEEQQKLIQEQKQILEELKQHQEIHKDGKQDSLLLENIKQNVDISQQNLAVAGNQAQPVQPQGQQEQVMKAGNQYVIGQQQLDGQLGGNQQVGGNQPIGENKQVVGNQLLGGNQQVDGNQQAGGNQQVAGNQQVGGNQQVVGNQLLVGNQQLAGNQPLQDNLQAAEIGNIPDNNLPMPGNQAFGNPVVGVNVQQGGLQPDIRQIPGKGVIQGHVPENPQFMQTVKEMGNDQNIVNPQLVDKLNIKHENVQKVADTKQEAYNVRKAREAAKGPEQELKEAAQEVHVNPDAVVKDLENVDINNNIVDPKVNIENDKLNGKDAIEQRPVVDMIDPNHREAIKLGR